MRHIFLLIFTLIPFTCFSQFFDDFNDGDFSANPTWLGDVDVFIVNAVNELQLMDVETEMSILYTPVSIADSTAWEFFVRLEFAPSTTNFARIYLSSDQSDLLGSLNGYYIKVGGESGALDKLELFKQEGSTSTSLLSGTDGAVGSDPAIARVRVTRDNSGNWEMFADYTGGTNYISEGTATDNSFPTGEFIGVWCDYTTTRADKFFFDDFSVSPTFMDILSPTLEGVEVNSSTEIVLSFNEALDQTSAENIANYSIDNGVGVTGAILSAIDPTMVTLNLSPAMINNTAYILVVANVSDINSNPIPPANPETINFTFFLIQEADLNDIIINEIMPDPNPVIGLPDAEYIEILNRADFSVNLDGYNIMRTNLESGTTKSSIIPASLMMPGQKIILCRSTDASLFEAFTDPQNIIGLSSFTDFLPNEDTSRLDLFDNSNTLINSTVYHSGLFNGVDRNGRSLELVNPEAICIGLSNWRASGDPSGGTPAVDNFELDLTFGTEAPAIIEVQAVSDTEVFVQFSKSLEELTAENPAGYLLSGAGTFNPVSASYDALAQMVLLSFSDSFVDGTEYTIQVLSTVTDCLGNPVSSPDQFSFTYVETQIAAVYDIIINEIYADPSPSNGLPETEFVELFNRSNKNINLRDFIISDRSTQVFLPDYIIEPGDYLIIYKSGGEGFHAYGDTLPLASFIALGNEQDDVVLTSPQNEIIHAVKYDISWYRNTSKDDGGWSLELINPNQVCEGSDNWRAAADLPGGTPGSQNSVFESTPDEKLPDLIKAFPITDMEILLFFSEAVDIATATVNSNYSISGNTVEVMSAEPISPLFNTVMLTLDDVLQEGEVYEISASDITDCQGLNIGLMNTVRVAIPEQISPDDLIINEILFNPVVGGVDFVELYNRSSKSLNLNDLIIANRDFNGDIFQTEAVEEDCLIFPGDYIVLTENSIQVKDQYMTPNPNGFLETGLPTWLDAAGDVVITIPDILGSTIIDEFHYSSDYHFSLLDDQNGVSLERIRFGGETQDPENWHSAAASVGFATPAYQNSQFFENLGPAEEMFSLAEETVSPDGDGFQDFLLVQYKTATPGFLANIWVYDARGRKIATITESELLATEGIFQWDGSTDDGTKARVGIYILFIEAFDLEGNVSNVKKTFVVAGKL